MRKAAAPILISLTCLYAFQASNSPKFVMTQEIRAAIDQVRPGSLRGDLSFIASDLLEGRDTPSRGLDVAAEYIAAQFRRAGLKPVGDDGYFQTAHYIVSDQSLDGFELTVRAGDRDLRIGKNDLRVVTAGKADFSDATPLKVKLDEVKPESVEGKIIV